MSPPAREDPGTRSGGGRASRLVPLYHQVYVHLRDLIQAGSAPPDAPLPSEPELARRYGVSRVTIRSTLARLEKDGLVLRRRGVGTFPVAAGPGDAPADIPGALESLISFEDRTTVVDLGWSRDVPPDAAARRALGPESCLRIVRVRSYEGRPVSFTTIHVPAGPARLLPGPTPSGTPVIRLLEQQGLVATAAEQTLTAVAASPEAAHHLQVAGGAPLIAMRRLMLDAGRAPILHQESLYVPERFEYRMRLSRTTVGPVAKWTPIG